MGSFSFDCEECGKATTAGADDMRRGELCYRCHLGGLSFGFRGAKGGRESFHSETIKEVQDATVKGAAEQGREVRPKSKVYYGL
jgi:hypothetical protein